MFRDDEGFPEDDIPIKRTRWQKYTRDNIRDTREPIRFKGDIITADNETCMNLTEEDNNVVRFFNRKVRSKQPT